jgi:hypothetical protein
MDAKGDERLIAHDPEGVDPVCRHDDRDARFQRNDAFLAVEPGFPAPFDDSQDLGPGNGLLK